MPQETLFISDLHLSAARPDITRRFLWFIENRAQGAERLYILGDLFDAYIGDDDNSSPNSEVKAALKKLTDSGTAVFFQHGNRDFLVGGQFADETGAALLGDWAVIDLYGEDALITHGDLLCTDDTLYQAARLRVRAEGWKRNALSKPLFVRQLYARWYRFKSGLDKGKKTLEIMDANPDAVSDAMRQHGVQTLIHGHTHRPAVHDLEIDGKPAKRFVLAEWNATGQVLRWQDKYQWIIETFD
ncbi:UDP-2,3-diacylglucosamine hydrolase [Gammaproteobacteria bacterium]|nr:UDP-2,3-diacylglucosamine hydrolase [Gammaproteobacteria bacterium]